MKPSKSFISKFLLAFVFLHFSSQQNFAQNKKYYFYHPECDYGSEITFSPITVLLNGGFDVLRNGKNSKEITRQHYAAGTENVMNNLLHPFNSIEKFGWKRFLTSEIFPVSTDTDKMQYFPNYGTHLFGHGMKFARLAEWFDYHKIEYPYVYAAFTSFCYVFLNEVVENNNKKCVNVDPIADMLVFNPLGILLFSTDWAKQFFSETLSLYDWSLQPVLNPANRHLINTGEQYVVNYRLSNNYSLFFYWGTSGILGLTRTINLEHNFSLGVGAIVNKLIEKKLVNSKAFAKYVAPETIDGAVGFFYDKNHSLMSSLIITGPVYYNAQLNIYPGFIRKDFFIPGLFCGIGELDKFQVGVTLAYFPIGIVSKF